MLLSGCLTNPRCVYMLRFLSSTLSLIVFVEYRQKPSTNLEDFEWLDNITANEKLPNAAVPLALSIKWQCKSMMFGSRPLCNSAWKHPDCTDKVEGGQFQWTLDEDLTTPLVLLLRSTHLSLYIDYPSANWFAPRKKYNFSCWVWVQVVLNVAGIANGHLAVGFWGAAPTPAPGLTRASGTCFTSPLTQGEQNSEQTNGLAGNAINPGLQMFVLQRT